MPMEGNDGFRVVTRAVRHELFNAWYGLKVETEASWISDASPCCTALDALVCVAQEYLGAKPEFEGWNDAVLELKGSPESDLLRPSNDRSEKGRVSLTEYFDALAKRTSRKSVLVRFQIDSLIGEGHGNAEKSPSELRQSQPKHPGARDDNILFRPIAQVALARAIAELQKRNGLGLKEAISCLFVRDRAERPLSSEQDGPLVRDSARYRRWRGQAAKEIRSSLRRDAGLSVRRRIRGRRGALGKLSDDFFEARRRTTDGNEPRAYDMSGSLKTRKEFRLPDPWNPNP